MNNQVFSVRNLAANENLQCALKFRLLLLLLVALLAFPKTVHAQGGGVTWIAVDQSELDIGSSIIGSNIGGGSLYHSYLRQLPAYRTMLGKPNTKHIDYYATRSIWVFGTGEIMLLDWVRDQAAGKFQIKFSFLDRQDVDKLLSLDPGPSRDAELRKLTDGALTQRTSAHFSDQAGSYWEEWSDWDGVPRRERLPLARLLMGSNQYTYYTYTPEFDTLLDAKYQTEDKKNAARELSDDLALDCQIYRSSGSYADDTQLTVYFPGYNPGVPGRDSTEDGWNTTISMGKDPELFMNAQGLTYHDLIGGNARWAVLVGWNTHLDYDGQDTAPFSPNQHAYLGLITPLNSADHQKGILYRALALLRTAWAGVPLDGERNIVSHSTGYYLARTFLDHTQSLWPAPAPPTRMRYFALSPNIRGSTMVGYCSPFSPRACAGQGYDSIDDMFRDNWHWLGDYRLNAATRAVKEYTLPPYLEAHIMLAYGDTTTAGVGGLRTIMTTASWTPPADIGVVDYTNYQPHYVTQIDPENLDDAEYGRLKRFSTYESLYNMWNDGGPLEKSLLTPEWANGGDAYLAGFPPSQTQVSVFGENVNLENQGGDDGEAYDRDHSDLAQRMMAIRFILNGHSPNLRPSPGVPVGVSYEAGNPGTVQFTWQEPEERKGLSAQVYAPELKSPTGGPIYEVVRRIKGSNTAYHGALLGWTDKWWQRVALKRPVTLVEGVAKKTCVESGEQCLYTAEFSTFETIRGVDSSDPTLWNFYSSAEALSGQMPTWLDQVFTLKDLWVRVANGPLEGAFFHVTDNLDYVGIGFSDNGGQAGVPPAFPDKKQIVLRIEPNSAFRDQQPVGGNYITLGGIQYQYHAAYYGSVPAIREAVKATVYTDSLENLNRGTGYFLSTDVVDAIEVNNPPGSTVPKLVSYPTDTIAPILLFDDGQN